MTGTQIFTLIMVGITCYFIVNMFDLYVKNKKANIQQDYLEKVINDQRVILNESLKRIKSLEVEK